MSSFIKSIFNRGVIQNGDNYVIQIGGIEEPLEKYSLQLYELFLKSQKEQKNEVINAINVMLESLDLSGDEQQIQEQLMKEFSSIDDKIEEIKNEIGDKMPERICDRLSGYFDGIHKRLAKIEELLNETPEKVAEMVVNYLCAHGWDQTHSKEELTDIVSKLNGKTIQEALNGTDCGRCGSSKAMKLRCAICDNESYSAMTRMSFEDNYNYDTDLERCGLLVVGPTSKDGKSLYIQDLDIVNDMDTSRVKRILIHSSVTAIYLGKEKDRNYQTCSSEGIVSVFNNLEAFSLMEKEGGYKLGKWLFRCGSLQNLPKLYGMEYVTEIEDGCFLVPNDVDEQTKLTYWDNANFNKGLYKREYFN